jgi:hypothetical protein
VMEEFRIAVETTLEDIEGEQKALDWDFELEWWERKDGGMAEAISRSFSYCMWIKILVKNINRFTQKIISVGPEFVWSQSWRTDSWNSRASLNLPLMIHLHFFGSKMYTHLLFSRNKIWNLGLKI